MPKPWEPFSERYEVAPTGCWIWQRCIGAGGYGTIYDPVRKKSVKAHRFSYELINGPIPAGLTIDHLCRVRRCVNPAHLEAVTFRENVLRGVGPTAQEARQTHCKYGHPLTEENLLRSRQGRKCKLCRRAYTSTPEFHAIRRADRARRKASGLPTWD